MTQYVISFPKCGRTWFRYMLVRALCYDAGVEFTSQSMRDPWLRSEGIFEKLGVEPVGFDHAGSAAFGCPSVTTAKKPALLIVRSIRDTLVSYYFHRHHRSGEEDRFEGSLSDFIMSPDGLPNLVSFYNAWADVYEREPFAVISYEGLHENPTYTFIAGCLALGYDPSITAVLEALAAGSFEEMQNHERKGTIEHPALQPPDTENVDTFKVRRGVVGGWKDHLTQYEDENVALYLHDHRRFGLRVGD